MVNSLCYMSVDISVRRHHVTKYQPVISVVTYSTTTWQLGKEVINAFSYLLDAYYKLPHRACH
jgi:hypothetical protein